MHEANSASQLTLVVTLPWHGGVASRPMRTKTTGDGKPDVGNETSPANTKTGSPWIVDRTSEYLGKGIIIVGVVPPSPATPAAPHAAETGADTADGKS